MPRPSAMPPEAITGIFRARTARGISTSPATSSSPGWPAHSKPSMLTMSTPLRSADSAWRTVVHLWMMVMPLSFMRAMKSLGLLPAVSTIFTPASMMTCRYSA